MKEHLKDYFAEVNETLALIREKYPMMQTEQQMALLNFSVVMWNSDHLNSNINGYVNFEDKTERVED